MHLLNIVRLSSVRASSSLATYKSPISVENLYPSKPQFLDRYSSPSLPPESTFSGWIPMDSISWTQDPHSTKITISFDPKKADWLPKEASLIPGRDGLITVTSDRTRSSLLNRADVLQKLRAVIRDSISPPIEKPIFEKERELQRKKSIKLAREKLILSSSEPSIFSDEPHINFF